MNPNTQQYLARTILMYIFLNENIVLLVYNNWDNDFYDNDKSRKESWRDFYVKLLILKSLRDIIILKFLTGTVWKWKIKFPERFRCWIKYSLDKYIKILLHFRVNQCYCLHLEFCSHFTGVCLYIFEKN